MDRLVSIEKSLSERQSIFELLNEKQLPIVGGCDQFQIIRDLVRKYENLQAEKDRLKGENERLMAVTNLCCNNLLSKKKLKQASKGD